MPDAVSDRLLRILYGSAGNRDLAIAGLRAEFPDCASAIAAHVAYAAELAASVAEVAAADLPHARRRKWSIAPGAVLGGYRIESFLGSGGMGSVHAATRLSDGMAVALKVLHPDILSHEGARARFDREGRALFALRHPGICEPLDLGEFEGCPFLAMRLVHGPTLAERVAEAVHESGGVGSFTRLLSEAAIERLLEGEVCCVDRRLGAVLRMLELVAEALAAAHSAGVVHRDIKPGNVMLEQEAMPVLVDFGLAAHELAATLTATGEMIGTPAYMAPEQIAADAKGIDARVDVYALGAVAYECLVGRPPFVAATHGELLRAIVRGSPEPLRDVDPELPASVDAVVAMAMRVDPGKRYSSAAALAADLACARQGLRVRARRMPLFERATAWVARNRGPSILALILAFGLAAMATVSAFVRANWRRVDLLATAALVEAARRDEAQLWPMLPGHEGRFVEWLERYGDEASDGGLPQRLMALRRQLGIPDDQPAPVARRTPESEFLQDEVELLAQLTPASGLGALPEDVVEAFRVRRREWLLAGKTSSSVPVPEVVEFEVDPHRTSLRAALHSVERYLSVDVDGRPGVIARVREGLSWLRDVEARTVLEHRAAWQQVRDRLASGRSPYLRPLDLAPQVGLVPLGADPASGLQEFAVLRSGPAPTRDHEGRLSCGPDTAVVLVLVPEGDALVGTARMRIGSDVLAFAPHHVALRPFFLGKFETTQAQWRRMGGGSPSQFRDGTRLGDATFGGEHPVDSVTRDEAREVLGWHGLVLPTEVQWEYAAKCGAVVADSAFCAPARENTATERWHRPTPPFASDDYHGGNLLPTPVGSLAPNAWGFHDLGGNLSEWCDDRFGAYLNPARPGDGRRQTSWGELAVARGGNFALAAEVHHRVPMPPDLRLALVGVRVARAVD
ncbi:MAG: SUMF1/EgtB/PvdO family nonheme iron enzyme [Planctomycetes bacterium]|nr:SUMF1/EgtB/PvdO family nonheme iron enzyme [Planctomycetota bacterium]